MIVLSLLLAPLVVAVALLIDRRLGASAAGWVAALPIGFGMAVVAVSLDAGGESAGTMALSAAAHVPAQLLFGMVFAAVVISRGAIVGFAAAVVTYAYSSLIVAELPPVLAVSAAVPLLFVAPRLIVAGRPLPGSARGLSTTVLTCLSASLVVGGAVVTTRLADPTAAGAVAAFPMITSTVVIGAIAHDGRMAGVNALTGLVRSLPCYFTFCLIVAFTAPAVGAGAVVLGLLGCLAAARATWRGVPTARQPALAGSAST